jgi:hypothetical protein
MRAALAGSARVKCGCPPGPFARALFCAASRLNDLELERVIHDHLVPLHDGHEATLVFAEPSRDDELPRPERKNIAVKRTCDTVPIP